MDFHPVETNLRDSFRTLCEGRQYADVSEVPGLSFASLGVAFQMFNAAFLSSPVVSKAELAHRIGTAALRFAQQKRQWSLWVCEDWIAGGIRRSLSKLCSTSGLRLVSELPGMGAVAVEVGRPHPGELQIREVETAATMADFRQVGANCFRVPAQWFAEVFDDQVWAQKRFRCFVGYCGTEPAATSAVLESGGIAGIYNVAVMPWFRGSGYGEAITRHAIREAGAVDGVVLQSTSQGLRMYRKMGFRPLTRILVYTSG